MTLTDQNPVITQETHESETTNVTAIYTVLAAALAAWGSAIYAFGIPGLYLPALAMVPVMWIILLIISRG